MILNDQVAVVTGAGQGIGKACALALAEAGAHVVAVDINGPNAEATAEAAGAYQRRSLALRADVGDLADIDSMVRQTMEKFGRIDILVNNAGVTRRADIMDLTEHDWDRIHRVNAKGVFFCLQRVAREMIPRRSGRIVSIASIAGKGYAGASNVAYAASKGAVISMTRLAALQLARHNITVNAICPGVTRTALSDDNLRVRAAAGGRDAGGDGTPARAGDPAATRQRSGGYRRHGRVPRVAGRAQHHRPVVQRGWRVDPGVAAQDSPSPCGRGPGGGVGQVRTDRPLPPTPSHKGRGSAGWFAVAVTHTQHDGDET